MKIKKIKRWLPWYKGKNKLQITTTALLYGLAFFIIFILSLPISPTQTETVRVSRVIDGDTIEIEGGQRVRYIGIDTPESTTQIECYGNEATQKNKELVGNKYIRLEKDVSETDRYGRLLRYVYVEDQFINDVLVREGYAQATSYPPDVKYQEMFRESERLARKEERGLWEEDCVAGATTEMLDKSCTGPDLDCSDFNTQAEAQTFFDECGFTATNDPMQLDGLRIGNGIACESLP